jgi:hypothetical protein
MIDPKDERDDLTSTASIQRALENAVDKALERKRRLGQYAVVYRNGRSVRLGIDLPWEQGNRPGKGS